MSSCLPCLSIRLPRPIYLKVRMSSKPSELEKSVEEVLKNIMADRSISEGVQASLTRGLQAFPSTGRRSGHVNPVTEQQSNHRGDLANVKQISSILPEYIPYLAGTVNHDNIPQDYEYTVFTTYIPKGIRVFGSQLGEIPLLKNNDFNLGDRNNYAMLVLHHYLTKSTGKKPHLVSQPLIKGMAPSTMLNVMNIPHFGNHQEVNVCVKLLLSCYHGGYLWLDKRIIVDPTLIHWIIGLSVKGPDPQQFYPGKASDHSLAQRIKEAYREVEK
jgi:hypothetical protein